VGLWKLAELDGKYGGEFVSEGVRALERQIGRPPAASSGMWPERRLRAVLGLRRREPAWRTTPAYRCQLDHVVQRSDLIDLLLREPERASDIEPLILGCVVLKNEHRRLATTPGTIDDPWRKYREAKGAPVRVWSRRTARWLF